MKSIRLYQIPFSHFCDKVRWSLDFYSIPYETIHYVGPQTPGLEKAPKSLQKLTPIIEDPNNESLFISDSTSILLYLDEHYGNEKSLFPSNSTVEKDVIVQYCLKLDSQLGLYARRLVYLYIINEKASILSMFVDGDFDKTSCDDWKSYFRGLMGSCFVLGRLGIHRIREEQIWEKTVSLLEEIQENLDEKEYLFNNQFTAADLTLTSLIHPLTLVKPLFIKYPSLFQYSDRIRERHDPKKDQYSNNIRLFKLPGKKGPIQSTIRNFIWKFFYILFYPFQFFFNINEKEKVLLQYPSRNLDEKAHNDVRVMKLKSIFNTIRFFIKHFYHLYFTIPKQMEFVNNEGKKILNKH